MATRSIEGRRVFTQPEVVLIARYLGLKNFDKSNIYYWKDQGLFKPAVSSTRFVLYNVNSLINDFLAVSGRVYKKVNVTETDIENAMRMVLKMNKVVNGESLNKLLPKE